jgi:hypothetical protein
VLYAEFLGSCYTCHQELRPAELVEEEAAE